ncbi:hypothetical protein IWX84_002894 [Flavobacterium sp. CG_9.10]|uniref:lantibiotic dehydratase family protein n=1 Tax=Flavobacterium sp. CG_9.10 TaxID=2787729 RepID=UPI0018CA7B22|nr:lantibiotic dehydratase family protein [Flavobacterium sp. CG_9.10]MBG6111999.1 hypothetical protein [Flavobacterium sp. CG_9.10]
MIDYKVQPFSQYVLRTPLFPASLYFHLLDNYSSESLLQLFANPFIREAIRMASPELLTALDKWKANPDSLSIKKKNGLELSLLKYLARMATRCTPFGLFAGCTLGNLASETTIVLESPQNFTRFTQFDMQFWVAMVQEFATRKEVRPYLTYYPNTSIYALGDFYRYIEYKHVKTKREHSISALRKSALLNEVLNRAKSGMTVNEMISFLADDDSEREDAEVFIDQLINFQFLVSELDASVTGNDEWGSVFTILNKIPILKTENEILKKIKKLFLELDITLVPSENSYQEIKRLIQKMGVEYDEKYLFQTDLNTTTSVNTLSKKVSNNAFQAIRFLNGIQKKKEALDQLNFIKAFTKRYESREMPLATVLDTEAGIGYLQNAEMNDTHDILEKFSIRSEIQDKENQPWSSYDFFLEKKLQECIFKKGKAITLSEKDFPDFDANWDKSPATFSVMIQLLKKEEISIESSGDVSAAKLLGRFCNGNIDIHNLTNEIVEKEKKQNPDKILAEIVHVPESRTGNILRRPVLRKHEIAYLSNSGVSQRHTIAINDLMVSVSNNQIILRSKKHNKEIIPCLSNAHNYTNKSLPIYHFLCDLQAQGVKPIYNFSWGVLELHYAFFPRVYYKSVILSKAKWMVTKNEIESFSKQAAHKLLEAFTIWRSEREIPRFVNWADSDNTLLVDFEKEVGVRLFLKSVQHHNKIVLEEFLFSEESAVKDSNGESFTNQVILSFYKEKQQAE